jgi:predicted adenylyl cyclase CyaB
MPPTQQYEIELKALLKSKQDVDDMMKSMMFMDSQCKLLKTEEQINSYFHGFGNLMDLAIKIQNTLSPQQLQDLHDFVLAHTNISVRTRQTNILETKLILKASIDKTSSENGISRKELEFEMPMSIERLDGLILESGFKYQAKWSRIRAVYKFLDITICIDKNAGFGYVIELEKMLDDPEMAEMAVSYLRTTMAKLGLKELAQDRLERMFEYYNNHWQEYYGTDKVFEIF